MHHQELGRGHLEGQVQGFLAVPQQSITAYRKTVSTISHSEVPKICFPDEQTDIVYSNYVTAVLIKQWYWGGGGRQVKDLQKLSLFILQPAKSHSNTFKVVYSNTMATI